MTMTMMTTNIPRPWSHYIPANLGQAIVFKCFDLVREPPDMRGWNDEAKEEYLLYLEEIEDETR